MWIARCLTPGARLERSSRARISRNGVWRCRSSGRREPPVARAIGRSLDQKAQAGQNIVPVLDGTAGDVLRQSAGADRLQHSIPQMGKGVQHGGDEHVAGHAADGVEVEMH